MLTAYILVELKISMQKWDFPCTKHSKSQMDNDIMFFNWLKMEYFYK